MIFALHIYQPYVSLSIFSSQWWAAMVFKQKYLAGAARVCSVGCSELGFCLRLMPQWKVLVCAGNGCISTCVCFAGIARSSAFVQKFDACIHTDVLNKSFLDIQIIVQLSLDLPCHLVDKYEILLLSNMIYSLLILSSLKPFEMRVCIIRLANTQCLLSKSV